MMNLQKSANLHDCSKYKSTAQLRNPKVKRCTLLTCIHFFHIEISSFRCSLHSLWLFDYQLRYHKNHGR